MLHLEDVVHLKDDEQVMLIVRRHGATLVPPLFLAFILIVIPFFMLFPLFSQGIVGIIIFGAAVILGIGVAVRAFILWDADAFIVTTLRVVDVDQRGVFNRFVAEAMLPAVQDISWHRHGFIETMLGMGSLTVRTGSTSKPIVAHHIAHPERVQETINDLRGKSPHAPKDGHAAAPAPVEKGKMLKDITGMLEGYSAEELQRIETVLKARERSAAADAFFTGDEEKKA